jgi:hypothetical protein
MVLSKLKFAQVRTAGRELTFTVEVARSALDGELLEMRKRWHVAEVEAVDVAAGDAEDPQADHVGKRRETASGDGRGAKLENLGVREVESVTEGFIREVRAADAE